MREEKGLTQEELSTKINVDRSTIAKWENGISYPSMKNLLKLTEIFNCSLDELVRGSEK